MKLIFKQRIFSWLDSYDVYDEYGNTVFTVKGKLSWGHLLKIYDANGNEVGTVKEKLLTLLPKFEMYYGEEYIGSICRELAFLTPMYNIDYNGWHVEGSWLEWDYSIVDYTGMKVASVSKEIWRLTDTYVINVKDPHDAIYALMLVLAIDADKCSRD